jgi:heme-degrading monooxygenase HmoA
MPIIRLIYITFPAEQATQAERNWKESCAPLMIKQHGCLSEELLRNIDHPGEYISYSEWEDEESIRRYLQSDDHQEIKRHNRSIVGATVVVKQYQVVG